MKALYLASSLALALFVPVTSHAADAQPNVGGKSTISAVRAINNQTAVGCNICFTCGGDWPVFAGSIRSVGDRPVERGGGCAGAPAARVDSSPFLCCR